MNLSQALNIVYDTNYTSMVPQGGYPYFDIQSIQTEKQPSWLDKIIAMIF